MNTIGIRYGQTGKMVAWGGAGFTALLLIVSGAQAATIGMGNIVSNGPGNCPVSLSDQNVDVENAATLSVDIGVTISENNEKEDWWLTYLQVRWTAWPNGPLGELVEPGQTPGDQTNNLHTELDSYDSPDYFSYHQQSTWPASSFKYEGEYGAEVTARIDHDDRTWIQEGGSGIWGSACDSGWVSANLVIHWIQNGGGEHVSIHM